MNQLTKREQFAVAAMQAILSREFAPNQLPPSNLVARASTEYADALMEVLQGEEPDSITREEDAYEA